MHVQALQALALNDKRHSTVGSKLRTLASQRHWLCRRNKELDPDDFEAMKAVLLAGLETKKGTSNYGYFKGQAKRYIECKPQEAELWRQVADATDKMWQVNQPREHAFEIVPATAELSAGLSDLMVDDFSFYSGWKFTSWTDCEPVIRAENGILSVVAPRRDKVRDMLGISKSKSVDLTAVSTLNIRLKATPGAHFGVELVIDGKLKRLAAYEVNDGEWNTHTYKLDGTRTTSLTLILAEPGAKAKCPEGEVVYEFDGVWFE